MSNIVTKSFGQNGYIKFSNKFIVQWGFATDNQTYVGRTIASLSASSFVVSVNQANKEPFYWIAIGYGR